MKKLLVPSLVLGGAASAVAQTNMVMNTALTESAITSVQTGMTTILERLGPAVIAIVLAGVAIWAIPRIIGSLRTAFTSGKGR